MRDPPPRPKPRRATIRLAAVCCSEGMHTYDSNEKLYQLPILSTTYEYTKRTWGADIMQMLPRYPLDSEKSSMKVMYQ